MERKERQEEKVSEDKYKPNMHFCHVRRQLESSSLVFRLMRLGAWYRLKNRFILRLYFTDKYTNCILMRYKGKGEAGTFSVVYNVPF